MFARAKNPARVTGGVTNSRSSADPFECQQLVKFRGREPAAAETGDTDPPPRIVERPGLRDGDVRNDPMRHHALIIARRVDGEDIAPP